jgi:nicotinate-nucleotide pyrophosphorylase (carboxylating)
MGQFINDMVRSSVEEWIKEQIKEDQLADHLSYLNKLPSASVQCRLVSKSDLHLVGLDFFLACFETFSKCEYSEDDISLLDNHYYTSENPLDFQFKCNFATAISVERFALNLIHRCSAIATTVKKYVEIARPHGIEILDTRKTHIGMRNWEKYAVQKAGGANHRMSQTDIFMIKDNHKKIFGGLKEAVEFFRSVGSFYKPVVVEIHDLDELKLALKLSLKHLMLDNFSISMVEEAVKLKAKEMTYEISGGVTLDNLRNFCIPGIDAISVGSLTQWPEKVDLSMYMDPQ